MKFNNKDYLVERISVANETVETRAFRNRVYVEKAVDVEFQQLNLFAPESYFHGETINGYTVDTAPIFMPNMVGGYMPGGLSEPGENPWEPGTPNIIFRALQRGYVVVIPAIRGRVLQDGKGKYIGKAPASIVDYKAAVRYLRFCSEEIPGDVEKIITNGTSAGGALSSLMGATGNHPDYEKYLSEIGAAKMPDNIFAASCYCPITNLEHADMAYEWQFLGINEYHRMNMKMDEGGRPAFTPEDGEMSENQIRVSSELASLFPAYINKLDLKDREGNSLTLNEVGEGSFKQYMKNIVISSGQRALEQGENLSDKEWLVIKDGQVVDMDWQGYVKDITRMKTAPAFDSLTMDSPENDLFGSEDVNFRHFTSYSKTNSITEGELAEEQIIKMMNPMDYIGDKQVTLAPHWRIRHGECDRDTSLAISAILELKLQEEGAYVDYFSPWNVPHAGDYDWEDLFAWMDSICK